MIHALQARGGVAQTSAGGDRFYEAAVLMSDGEAAARKIRVADARNPEPSLRTGHPAVLKAVCEGKFQAGIST